MATLPVVCLHIGYYILLVCTSLYWGIHSKQSKHQQTRFLNAGIVGEVAFLVGLDHPLTLVTLRRVNWGIWVDIYQPKLETGTYPHKIKEQIINTIQSPTLP